MELIDFVEMKGRNDRLHRVKKFVMSSKMNEKAWEGRNRKGTAPKMTRHDPDRTLPAIECVSRTVLDNSLFP